MSGADLTFRFANEGDAEIVHSIYAPLVRDTAISFELEPPDVEEIRRRIRTTQERYPWLIAEDATRVLGYAYATAFRPRLAYQWTAEVTVYVTAEARGRGVGRALLERLTRLLEQQGFRSAIGAIALPNEASVALHEKCGFVKIAHLAEVGFKHGKWIDVGYWQLKLASRPSGDAPQPITHFRL